MSGDEDFRIRPGRIRSRGSQRVLPIITQALVAAQRRVEPRGLGLGVRGDGGVPRAAAAQSRRELGSGKRRRGRRQRRRKALLTRAGAGLGES